MDAVLGIDAAWTESRPSGVALVKKSGPTWTCVGVAPSYEAFLALPQGVMVDWEGTFRGSKPDPCALLEAAKRLLMGETVSVVTVDMPVSLRLVNGRREADNAISKEFGKQHCGTHTPSAHRPGRIGERLTKGFEDEGYPLAVKGNCENMVRRLVEAYPHPALLALLNANDRIPYKVAKTGKYWKGVSLEKRIQNLLEQHAKIIKALSEQIAGIPMELPHHESIKSLSGLKPYEDALDALVCAWVGIKYLRDEAKPYGNENAAIWVPG
jgi:predicted RNase H-like nuclease